MTVQYAQDVVCPECTGHSFKRTKTAVILDYVPTMCLLCGHKFEVHKDKVKRYGT